MPAIVYSAERDDVVVVCGQGPAPAAATPERFAELGLDLIPGTGPLAAVVPGAFDAWMLMLRDFGTWELADVMAPAIGYAGDGYPLVPGIRAAIEGVEDLLREEWTSSAEVYLPLPRAGERFRNARAGRDLRADRAREHPRGEHARGPHRRRARRVLPRLGGRGDRRLDARGRGDGRERRAPSRAADRRRPRGLGRRRSRRR